MPHTPTTAHTAPVGAGKWVGRGEVVGTGGGGGINMLLLRRCVT